MKNRTETPRISVLFGRHSAHYIDWLTVDLLEPALQLFQRPTMTGQSMLFRLGLADNAHEPLDLLWAEKGRRPPV